MRLLPSRIQKTCGMRFFRKVQACKKLRGDVAALRRTSKFRSTTPRLRKRLIPLYSDHGHAVAAEASLRLLHRLLVREAELNFLVVPLAGPLLAMHFGLMGAGRRIEPGHLLVLVVDGKIGEDIIHQLV